MAAFPPNDPAAAPFGALPEAPGEAFGGAPGAPQPLFPPALDAAPGDPLTAAADDGPAAVNAQMMLLHQYYPPNALFDTAQHGSSARVGEQLSCVLL